MKKIYFISLLIISIILTIGCEDTKINKKKQSTGKTNELLVVFQGVSIGSMIGDTIKSFFEQSDKMLSQPEKLYMVATINKEQFDNTNVFNVHHNILIIRKDSSIKKSNVETLENLWSEPQRVVWMNFSEDSSFYKLFDVYKESILQMFDDIEVARTHNILLLNKGYTANSTIETIFKIDLDIPEGFSIATTDTNFIWLKQRIEKKDQDLTASILIWQRPYTSEKQFTVDNLVISRDAIAQKYIAGSIDGSFMKTSLEYIIPETKVVTHFPTNYAVEMRGLWDLVGDFMGGPFISYSFVHPHTQQFITIEGFLYNPNREKRVILRQLESIMKNIRIKEVTTVN